LFFFFNLILFLFLSFLLNLMLFLYLIAVGSRLIFRAQFEAKSRYLMDNFFLTHIFKPFFELFKAYLQFCLLLWIFSRLCRVVDKGATILDELYNLGVVVGPL
jgi:hypothetical protein